MYALLQLPLTAFYMSKGVNLKGQRKSKTAHWDFNIVKFTNQLFKLLVYRNKGIKYITKFFIIIHSFDIPAKRNIVHSVVKKHTTDRINKYL
jgi:hypothetical protein